MKRLIMQITGTAILSLALTASVLSAPTVEINHVGAIEESLSAPTSIVVTGERVVVLEPYAKQLRAFTPDGIIESKANFDGQATGLLAVSESVFLICDRSLKQIIAIDINDESQFDYFANRFSFNDPVDLVRLSDRFAALDAGSAEIIEFSFDGAYLRRISLKRTEEHPLSGLTNLACNATSNMYYVFDQTSSTILAFDQSGIIQNSFCSFGADGGQVTRGGDMLCSSDGLVIVADRYQNRIVVFDDAGDFLTTFSSKDFDRPRLNVPTGLALDENGVVYVSSTEGGRVEMFHVVRKTTGADAFTIEQLYPQSSTTVSATDIKLVAMISTDADASIIEGVEFRLFTSNDLDNPLMEVYVIELTSYEEGSTSSVLAEWQLDRDLEIGAEYAWQARLTVNGSFGEWTDLSFFQIDVLPVQFSLEQNYPNPFNPETIIGFILPEESHATLAIYNLIGQEIHTLVDEVRSSGRHEEIWTGHGYGGTAMASGVYFYRLKAGEHTQTRKMVLLR